jgi:hypothetical protein
MESLDDSHIDTPTTHWLYSIHDCIKDGFTQNQVIRLNPPCLLISTYEQRHTKNNVAQFILISHGDPQNFIWRSCWAQFG